MSNSKAFVGILSALVTLAIIVTALSLAHTSGEAREDDWFNTKSPSGKCYEVFNKSRGSIGYHFVMFEVACK